MTNDSNKIVQVYKTKNKVMPYALVFIINSPDRPAQECVQSIARFPTRDSAFAAAHKLKPNVDDFTAWISDL